MKTKSYFTVLLLLVALAWIPKSYAQNAERDAINTLLDNLNKDAAASNFDAYFTNFADGAIFIGTDPTEIWDVPQFKAYAKPIFDKKQGWNFKSIQRHINFDKTVTIAWFDELLDTSMKICRGSGVLEKINGQWKIKQYVLSLTIPNNDLDAVIKIVGPSQDLLLKNYLLKK